MIVRVILASVQRVAVRNARPITNVAEWYSDLSFHFARDQADLQKMTYNARTGERTAQNRSQRSTTGSQLGPTTSDPNIRATATGSPAAIPRLVQRVWPRMTIGVIFVLEVVWVVFLVYLSIAFVSFAFLRP